MYGACSDFKSADLVLCRALCRGGRRAAILALLWLLCRQNFVTLQLEKSEQTEFDESIEIRRHFRRLG